MRDDNKNDEELEDVVTVPVGDVIGDTAYSERFVLKILLKLANMDTLKEEIQEKPFEDDLCTLWDMTAERDVVLFLQKHDLLKLVNFALPVIDSPRIIEIIIGIIGNMCCHKEVVTTLLTINNLLNSLIVYIKSDDSLILIQVLRLVNSSLFLVADVDISIWMALFQEVDYSQALYFILKNSSSKELLVTALENLNTICTYCNTEMHRVNFFTHFVKSEAVECLDVAFKEIISLQDLERDELERVLVLSLQITLNLIGFDKSQEIYENSRDNVANMIKHILNYCENKVVKEKEIDADLLDVIESTNTVVNIMNISETCEADNFFLQSYNIWDAVRSITKPNQNGASFEDDEKQDIKVFADKINTPLGTLMCSYIDKCTEANLLKVLDKIDDDYENILSSVEDKKLMLPVAKRATNYRSRLKDNVDS